jgi:hypothetical protein
MATDSHGGGIDNAGTLSIDHSTLAKNNALGGNTATGGAIRNIGSLTIDQTILTKNNAAGADSGGGGIHNTADLSITNSVLSSNTAKAYNGFKGWNAFSVPSGMSGENGMNGGDGGFAKGGGIYSTGTTSLIKCTVSGNTIQSGSGGSGGNGGKGSGYGSYGGNGGNGGTAGDANGGGIFSFGPYDQTSLTIKDSTISGNKATAGKSARGAGPDCKALREPQEPRRTAMAAGFTPAGFSWI